MELRRRGMRVGPRVLHSVKKLVGTFILFYITCIYQQLVKKLNC